MGIDFPMSQLEMWIAQACDPLTTMTPNFSLNLEICELININGKTYPRDAAFSIVKQINYSSSTAALALPLLDNCVKNCGYPFHLVMSSKEFLNELVRKFPETPKAVTSTQRKILELIAEWNITYAQKSRYREDFKNIHEMYRLLEYKGYQFPHIKEEATNIEPEIVLKTEEQLESEDMKNNGLKLEELIRKGTPASLAEANDMMKLMSGYDTSKKPDYKKEVNSELERIESKTILLNDMLNQKSPEDFRLRQDQTIESLYSSAKVAQTRLQKFIEDSEDSERLGRLLEMNDSINVVLQKYTDLKNGSPVEKNSLDRKSGPAEKSIGSSTGQQQERGAINLIDLDDIPDVKQSFAFDPFESSSQNMKSPPQQATASSLLGDFNSINFHQQQTMSEFGQFGFNQGSMQRPPMMSNQMSFGDNYGNQPMNNISGINGASSMMNSAPLNMPHHQQFQAKAGFQQQQQTPAPARQASPFDDLFSSVPQPQSQQAPIQSNLSTFSQPQDLLGLFDGPTQFASRPSIQQQGSKAYQNTVGVPSLSKENVIFNKNGLQIKLTTPSPTNATKLNVEAVFLNVTPVPFTDLNFQLSLPKSMSVQMEPLSSAVLAPFNQTPASQKIVIFNPAREVLRLKFKIQYCMNGAVVSEIGDFASQ